MLTYTPRESSMAATYSSPNTLTLKVGHTLASLWIPTAGSNSTMEEVMWAGPREQAARDPGLWNVFY